MTDLPGKSLTATELGEIAEELAAVARRYVAGARHAIEHGYGDDRIVGNEAAEIQMSAMYRDSAARVDALSVRCMEAAAQFDAPEGTVGQHEARLIAANATDLRDNLHRVDHGGGYVSHEPIDPTKTWGLTRYSMHVEQQGRGYMIEPREASGGLWVRYSDLLARMSMPPTGLARLAADRLALERKVAELKETIVDMIAAKNFDFIRDGDTMREQRAEISDLKKGFWSLSKRLAKYDDLAKEALEPDADASSIRDALSLLAPR